MKYLYIFLFIAFSCIATCVSAQNVDSLLNTLDTVKRSDKVIATFKSPNVVFSQSNETRKAHSLGLVFRHDFGPLGGRFGGSHTLYGLDVVQDVYIGFDYGISDRLSVAFGRSTTSETYNVNIKYKLLQQTIDAAMPVSLTLFAQPALITRKPFSSNEFEPYGNRASAFFQAIIARKFGSRFSLEIMPSYLYQAKTADFDLLDTRNLFSVGAAGRLKLTKRFALLADYQYVNGLSRRSGTLANHTYYNPLGVGVEMETGGHVFSLLFQNTNNILENNLIPTTTKSWLHGGASFAFSISRDFNLQHKNKTR